MNVVKNLLHMLYFLALVQNLSSDSGEDQKKKGFHPKVVLSSAEFRIIYNNRQFFHLLYVRSLLLVGEALNLFGGMLKS